MSLRKLCVVGALGVGVLACLGADVLAARLDVAAAARRIAPGVIVPDEQTARDMPPPPHDFDESNVPNDDIGLDPDLETNFNIEPIEIVTIPELPPLGLPN